jgi:hypothetical protein
MATNMTEHVIGRVGLQIEAKDLGEPSELNVTSKRRSVQNKCNSASGRPSSLKI